MAGGKITRIIKGTNSIECEKWEVYTDNFSAYANKGSYFTADGGTNFGTPKDPPPPNKYFEKGWWTDKEDKPITEAKILNIVRFHVQTQNIEKPEGKNITIAFYEHDYAIPIPLTFGLSSYSTDDHIRIMRGNNEITTMQLDKEGKGYIEISLDWGLNNLFNEETLGFNEEGGDLELYFKCGYDDQENVHLPNSFGDYLKVKRSEQNLFIKPFSVENQYNFPEIFNHLGEFILFAIDKDDISFKKFAAVKIKTTTFFNSIEGVNLFKKQVFTEGIDFSTGAHNFKNFTVNEVEHFYKTTKPIKMVYIEETLKTIKLDQSYKGIISYNSINKVLKYGRNANLVYGSYQLLTEMKEMIPAISENGEFNKPSLSSFVGMIPMSAPLAFGFAVLEWVSMDIMKDFNDMYDEMKLIKLENAKRSGLIQVRNLLHFRKNDYKDYDFIEDVPQATIDKLLKGQIKNYLQLDKSKVIDGLENEEKWKKGIDYNKTKYSIILKKQRDESINDYILIVESIIIQVDNETDNNILNINNPF